MKSRFKAGSIPTIFLTKAMKTAPDHKTIDVVLSPEFYWFRSEMMPIRSESQAKKLASSVFEGSIPPGDYQYAAFIREEGTIWFFAFDLDQIRTQLTNVGIRIGAVHAFYFVQTECSDLEGALKVDDERVLVRIDDVVSLLPAQYAETSETVDDFLKSHPRSRKKVSINFYYNTLLDATTINRLAAVGIVTILLFFGSYLLHRQEYIVAKTKELTLQRKYALPETSFQLRALRKALRHTERRQILLRKNLKKIFELPLGKGEYLTAFSYNKGKVSIKIALADDKRAETLSRYIGKAFTITQNPKVKNHVLSIKAKDE